MNETAKNLQPPATRAGANSFIAIAMCDIIPEITEPQGKFTDYLAGIYLTRLLEKSLHLQGVETFDSFGYSGRLTRAVIIFQVPQLHPALEILKEELKRSALLDLCVIAFLDQREGYWRNIFPENSTYDFHARIGDFTNMQAELNQQGEFASEYLRFLFKPTPPKP